MQIRPWTEQERLALEKALDLIERGQPLPADIAFSAHCAMLDCKDGAGAGAAIWCTAPSEEIAIRITRESLEVQRDDIRTMIDMERCSSTH